MIENGDWELRVDWKMVEKVNDKLINIKDILIEFGITSSDADLIVGNLIFLPPIDSLDSDDLDSMIINYAKYIKKTYDSCKKRKYPFETILEIINAFPFIIENPQDAANWSDFEDFSAFLSLQLEFRHIIFDKLIECEMPINLNYIIVGKINVMINPLFLHIAPKELEKVLNTWCINLFLYRKSLLKKFGTDARFIGILPTQQINLMKTEQGDNINNNDNEDE